MAAENYSWVPDEFFTKEQCQRLAELKSRWRTALDAGGSLPAEEQAELEVLVDAELIASGQRAAAMQKR